MTLLIRVVRFAVRAIWPVSIGLFVIRAIWPRLPEKTRPWVIAGLVLFIVALFRWLFYTWAHLAD